MLPLIFIAWLTGTIIFLWAFILVREPGDSALNILLVLVWPALLIVGTYIRITEGKV